MSVDNTVPKMIFGSGVSSPKDYNDFLVVAKVAVENGCRSFDTAPSYQMEPVLGEVVKQCKAQYKLTREEFFVQTKIDAWQMQESDGNVVGYVEYAIKEMGVGYLDSLLIHWPIPEYLERTWISFQQMKREGIVKSIGISNLRLRHLKKLYDIDIIPDVIQIERHPLMVFEKEIEFCKVNNIVIQAYSPLCKMHLHLKENLLLKALAKKYGKSIGQIILRWHIDTGVIPVFTSSKAERVKENVNVFDFSLSADDIEIISSLNENYKLCLESIACPGF